MAKTYEDLLNATPEISELQEHVRLGNNSLLPVGTQLKLDSRMLCHIIDDQNSSLDSKLIRMFQFWLDSSHEPTRAKLLEVLGKKFIGEERLANNYEKHLKEISSDKGEFSSTS